tara:strand:+ start:6586 stop:6948 length:363 start_codon:yes stop_codon:yes gene_type:complete
MTNNNVHSDFMVIMCEMSVMYFDHHITKKLYSFEAHCLNVTKALRDPVKYESEIGSIIYRNLIIFLMLELESQYGVVGDRATKIIIDFYTNEYWVGIYKSQVEQNKRLFPSGYYKKLKGL